MGGFGCRERHSLNGSERLVSWYKGEIWEREDNCHIGDLSGAMSHSKGTQTSKV